MTAEMVEKFVEHQQRKGGPVNIYFKDRRTVKGLFIKGVDYKELKSKNFWRIVSDTQLKSWEQSNDINCTRIFSGLSFTKLADV
jgi:hypothetical protein